MWEVRRCECGGGYVKVGVWEVGRCECGGGYVKVGVRECVGGR